MMLVVGCVERDQVSRIDKDRFQSAPPYRYRSCRAEPSETPHETGFRPQAEQRVHAFLFTEVVEEAPHQLFSFSHGGLEGFRFEFLNAHVPPSCSGPLECNDRGAYGYCGVSLKD